eukprot:3821460-Ditylum_brightwellii.AAC.1
MNNNRKDDASIIALDEPSLSGTLDEWMEAAEGESSIVCLMNFLATIKPNCLMSRAAQSN